MSNKEYMNEMKIIFLSENREINKFLSVLFRRQS
jgi:hypothetical protein